MAFVVSAVAGFSAVAAAAGTLAAIASVATAVATLGTVMTVVGAVTGSKKLMKYGGYLGLAGGVVSIGASLVSSSMSAAGSAAASSAADAAVDTAATSAGEEVAKSYAVDLGTDDIIKSAFDSSSATNMSGNALSGAAIQQPLSEVALGGDAINTSSNISSAGNVSSASNIAGSQVAPIGASDLAFKAPDITSSQISNAGSAFSVAPTSSGNWLSDWWGSLDQSQKNAAMQMGGKAAEGLFAGWSQEQRNKFEQEKFNLMMQNANAQPVMKFNNAGLINSKG